MPFQFSVRVWTFTRTREDIEGSVIQLKTRLRLDSHEDLLAVLERHLRARQAKLQASSATACFVGRTIPVLCPQLFEPTAPMDRSLTLLVS